MGAAAAGAAAAGAAAASAEDRDAADRDEPDVAADRDKPDDAADRDEPDDAADRDEPDRDASGGAADRDEPAEPAPAAPGEIPVAPVPRATPLPRRPPAPAAPLRQPGRSTTLPPRRPAPQRPSLSGGGVAGSRGVVIGVGLGVIALAAGALFATGVIGGGDDPAPAPNTAASPPAGQPPQAATLTPAATRIAVFNGTTIPGLASTEKDRLVTPTAGYADGNVTTGNNTDQQRGDSSVLHGTRPGARTQARNVARLLEIQTVERLDADTRDLAENDPDVVVILGQDKAP